MTTQEAINAIYRGKLVTCTAGEWPELRTAIQKQAATWIDQKQDLEAPDRASGSAAARSGAQLHDWIKDPPSAGADPPLSRERRLLVGDGDLSVGHHSSAVTKRTYGEFEDTAFNLAPSFRWHLITDEDGYQLLVATDGRLPRVDPLPAPGSEAQLAEGLCKLREALWWSDVKDEWVLGFLDRSEIDDPRELLEEAQQRLVTLTAENVEIERERKALGRELTRVEDSECELRERLQQLTAENQALRERERITPREESDELRRSRPR